MKFLIDAMFSAEVASKLNARGHDAVSPLNLASTGLSDASLIAIATEQERVIVTENWRDLADVTGCAVVFVLKDWWHSRAIPERQSAALDRWAAANPSPGKWFHWLPAEFR